VQAAVKAFAMKRIASYILFILISIVALASGAYGMSGGESFPTRKSLENISSRSAFIVILVTVALIAGLTVTLIRAYSY
jgi:hypothetical protein